MFLCALLLTVTLPIASTLANFSSLQTCCESETEDRWICSSLCSCITVKTDGAIYLEISTGVRSVRVTGAGAVHLFVSTKDDLTKR